MNCLGMGAGPLLEDCSSYPIRGALVRCKRSTTVPVQAFMHADHPAGIAYVVSRPDLCLLGGTTDVGNSSTQTTKEETEAIISRCEAAIPDLSKNEDIRKSVLETWAGIRPGRVSVRVELDNSFEVPVVHNYGHGGSGWTISWGCALDAAELAREILKKGSKL